ncbi:hypothetical protein C0V73_21155 [Rhizobium sp. TH135]|uniref:FkbM family methyltransferase n=1 Tax=Rhizobium sp. TH135 TaxID=2067451 RepID=UPI000C7D8C7E|nr:FkbM family methyltransferase [Rhizobium sp. TH135]PLK68878.1 hypothetical protein C0V73_21155 [Rhizobium sp. TH135]
MRKITRSARLLEAMKNLKPFTGSWLAALRVVVLRKLRPDSLLKGSYRSQKFLFRRIDCNALFEVFGDNEYGFLQADIMGAQAPLVIDVGAHIGTFALWTLALNPRAQILSVEADPQTFGVLEHNRALARGAWHTIHRAASDKNGETLLFSDDGPSMSHRVSATGRVEVQSIALEALLDTAGQGREIDVLKIDIEGAEELFLAGKQKALSFVKCLVVELHPNLCDVDRVVETLRGRFDKIDYVGGRKSNKPLIVCRD